MNKVKKRQIQLPKPAVKPKLQKLPKLPIKEEPFYEEIGLT